MMLTDLADACRKSGLTVVEEPGWRLRGHGQMGQVSTIVAHHTATAATARGDYPSLGIVRDGTSTLDGPLAQLGLGRNGTVYVIAAGLCYHAGVVAQPAYGNGYAIGIEAEHPGTGPWPVAQYDAYVRLCSTLADHYGLLVEDVRGHKEVASPPGRKVDPSFSMPAFRDDIRALRDHERQVAAEERAIAKQAAQDQTLRSELTDATQAAKKAGRTSIAERLRGMRDRIGKPKS